MTSERFGELLRRPRLLTGQNAIELEELIASHPWCGPLRVLRYRKAVLEESDDLPLWRARAGPFLSHGAVRSEERTLQTSYPARAEVHFGFDEEAVAAEASIAKEVQGAPAAPTAAALDLADCILTASSAVDTAEWYLHRNGLIMEFGRPRPAPIEQLDSYKRWKRRRVRASWDELLRLGIGSEGKRKKKKRKSAPAPPSTPEVASETLAQLLADQGHTTRAIEMYEQLSLRYPGKKGNFAARIEALRQTEA